MSLTFESKNDLERLIRCDDNAGIVSHLEKLISEGAVGAEGKLLLGVLLLLPPIAAYDEAAEIFESLLGGPRSFEAAAWASYRYASLQPDGSRRFETYLQERKYSAVALHLRSLISLADNQVDKFLQENQQSRQTRLFPFNVISALDNRYPIGSAERGPLLQVLSDLVISRTAELDPGVSTIEGLLCRKWDNLIVGTRLTSKYWDLINSQSA